MKPQPTEETIAQRRALLEIEWHFEMQVEQFAREKLKPITCYLCPICEEKHRDQFDASQCCPVRTEKDRAYECPTCNELYDTAAEAYLCCDDNQAEIPPDDGLRYLIEHAQLEKQGQTRLFQ